MTTPSTPRQPRRLSFARAPFFQLVFANAMKASDHSLTVALLHDALRREPVFPGFILEAAGRRLAELGDRKRAIAAYRAAIVAEPRLSPPLAGLLAMAKRAGQEPSQFWTRACMALHASAPVQFSSVLFEGAQRAFEQRSYLASLSAVADTLDPDTYLEIGTNKGSSLWRFRAARRTIGIDPGAEIDLNRFPELEFHAETSDAYFERTLSEADPPVADVVFIDGLHESDQVLRDFANTERLTARPATVMLHDVIPLNGLTAEKTRRLEFWIGDCWRALHYITRTRDDLDVAIVPAEPSGLAIARLPAEQEAGASSTDLDGFATSADDLELERDLAPMLLALPWVEPDRDSIADYLAGQETPQSGYERFDFTADDILLLMSCTPSDSPLDMNARTRVHLVLNPADPVSLTQAKLSSGAAPQNVRHWAQCTLPTVAADRKAL